MWWGGALLLLLFLLLWVPVTVELSIRDVRARRLWVVSWWGPIRVGASSPSSSLAKEPDGVRPTPTEGQSRSRKKEKRISSRRFRAALVSRELWRSLARLGRRLLATLRPRNVQLRLRFGLGDPAETGKLWGALSPLIVALTLLGAEQMELEPDFGQSSFELSGRATLRVVPAVVLGIALGYLFTPAPWRALGRFVRA